MEPAPGALRHEPRCLTKIAHQERDSTKGFDRGRGFRLGNPGFTAPPVFWGSTRLNWGQAPLCAGATSNALRSTRYGPEPEHPPFARVYLLPCIAGTFLCCDAAAVALSDSAD